MATVSLVTLAGCKKKAGGSDSLAKMEGFQKSMCECKDKACADKVNADMAAWGTEMSKTADKNAKPDPDMAKKSADVMTKYSECMTKLMMAGAGDMKGGGDMGSAKTPPPDQGSATPPPAAGSAAAKEPHKALEALTKVPAKATTAKVGQMAWVLRGTAFDSPDSFRVDVDEVTAIDGNTVTTRPVALMASGPDSWKHKPNPDERPYAGLPGLLVIPARTVEEVKPKVGDIVWAYIGNTTTPELTHVKAVEGGIVTYEVPNAMKDKLEEKKTDLIEPYGKGVAPFTMVAYTEGTDTKTMTVLAISGDKVFGYEFGGKLVEQKKSAVKPLTPVFKDRKVGDKVFVVGEAKPEEIKEILVPKELFKTGVFTRTWIELFDKATP
ncbi:MAG: hypothetical protein H0V17_20415 [Deltaproteobacteria bacterium]|nr:hypothetical protein [Deltaproteobacteria bacterium]